jgi:hypothetical protein
MVQLATILEVDVVATEGLINKVPLGKADFECLEEASKESELSEPEAELDVAPSYADFLANEVSNALRKDPAAAKAKSRRRGSLIDKAAKIQASSQDLQLVPAHIPMSELKVDWSDLVQQAAYDRGETIATIGVRNADSDVPKKGLKHNRKKSLIDKAAMQQQMMNKTQRRDTKTDSGSRACAQSVEDVLLRRPTIAKRFCSLCEGTKFCVLCNGAS